MGHLLVRHVEAKEENLENLSIYSFRLISEQIISQENSMKFTVRRCSEKVVMFPDDVFPVRWPDNMLVSAD